MNASSDVDLIEGSGRLLLRVAGVGVEVTAGGVDVVIESPLSDEFSTPGLADTVML